MFLGGIVAAAAATAVKKRVYIFQVIKNNLGFGEFKLFKWSQILITYSNILYFYYMKKKCKKIKEEATEATTLPFKYLTLGKIFSKKSPRCPQILFKGGWYMEM